MNQDARIVIQGGWLAQSLIDEVAALAGAASIEPCDDRIVRLRGFPAWPDATRTARITDRCTAARADVAFIRRPRPLNAFKLAVMDMDSTLITIECIDEIADLQGLKPEVSAITAAAMRGELDYPESLKRRVALLRGLGVEALEQVYSERLRLSPGAEVMLGAFASAGLSTLLVSGGFTFFTERLKQRLGLDDARANTLGVDNGKLTGEVIGEIVDAAAKRRELLAACARLGADPADAIAIGDGANDLAMMGAAGVSIAYRAKPVVRAQASHAISHNGLEAVLPLFGA